MGGDLRIGTGGALAFDGEGTIQALSSSNAIILGNAASNTELVTGNSLVVIPGADSGNSQPLFAIEADGKVSLDSNNVVSKLSFGNDPLKYTDRMIGLHDDATNYFGLGSLFQR